MQELLQTLSVFEKDAGVGAIVLTGSPKAFAAGADIKEMSSWSFADCRRADYRKTILGIGEVSKCKKPIVAAVDGFALVSLKWCTGALAGCLC